METQNPAAELPTGPEIAEEIARQGGDPPGSGLYPHIATLNGVAVIAGGPPDKNPWGMI